MAKKIPFFISIAVLYLSLGCISFGTREIVMPDQEVLGNQGYMEGSPSSDCGEREVTKKKIYEIEIEIPDLFQKDSTRSYDESIWGNQGYFQKGATRKPNIYIAPRKKVLPVLESKEENEDVEEVLNTVSPCVWEPIEPTEREYTDYVVLEGDSLWIISKKVYNDATKWNLISESNQDILKGCKYLKPGMVLKIPALEEDISQYIK